jgi:hypothetical protein
LADLRMSWLWLTGELDDELSRIPPPVKAERNSVSR